MFSLDTWGVILFWVGAISLFAVVIRRDSRKRDNQPRKPDYLLLFVGIAGMIAGLALIFLPDFP